jgi:DNA-directed RNA polymerase specialized sigma24 family protein
MAVHPLPEIALQEETQLVEKAQQGDSLAFGSLLEPWRKPLFGYIYRMVMLRQDAEDLLQDVLVRAYFGGGVQWRGRRYGGGFPDERKT